MFTVELKNLQDSVSGYYWCAVEITGGSDDGDYLYLTVSSDPAVSVINSRVSGQEGGSVSVQCLYSDKYKNQKRNWCRFEDRRCISGGKTTESYNSAVLVTDYGQGSVSVEMRGLQKSDAGWYWFSAGDVGVTVHLTVTERPSSSKTMTKNPETATAELTPNPPAATVSEKEHGTSKSGKIQDNRHIIPHLGRFLWAKIVSVSSSALDHENDVIYSSVATTTKKKTLSQAVRDDEVIYSSVVLEKR
ncbi:hypothetical protein MHYP_G00238100 [Metynnis hypsauchen]